MKNSAYIILIAAVMIVNLCCNKQDGKDSNQPVRDSVNILVGRNQSLIINDTSIANAIYYISYGPNVTDTLKLKSGHLKYKYVDIPDDTTFESLDLDKVAYGDLNGDGKIDAAVILRDWTGGSGIFVTVNAVIDSNNSPYHLVSSDIGDRTMIDSIWINSDVINIKGRSWVPEDSVFYQFKLNGNSLVEVH